MKSFLHFSVGEEFAIWKRIITALKQTIQTNQRRCNENVKQFCPLVSAFASNNNILKDPHRIDITRCTQNSRTQCLYSSCLRRSSTARRANFKNLSTQLCQERKNITRKIEAHIDRNAITHVLFLIT